MTTLEKIKAEIEQTTDDYNPARDAFDGGYVMAIRDVLQIIDKYAELECNGEFREDYCCGCTGYEECKQEYDELMEEKEI